MCVCVCVGGGWFRASVILLEGRGGGGGEEGLERVLFK